MTANTWRKSEQFDPYVKKFRSLFDMHNVQSGSPEDLPGFMIKLAQDRHFAMDFWALTGTLSKREGGELSVEEVLAVIVDAVTGGDIPADGDGHKILVDELATLLAGVDLYSPSRMSDIDADTFVPPPPVPPIAHAPPPISPITHAPPVSPITHAVAQATSADVRNRAVSEVPLPSSAPAPAFVAANAKFAAEVKDDSEPVPSSTPIATVQHQLDEALMRLELNSLELKEHLDDLDKKVSRIEPHLEALTSKVNFTERISHPVEAPTDKVFERVVRKPAENPRLILEPREEPFAGKHDDSSIRTPLAGYSQQSGHRGLVLLVVIFALLIAGGIVLQQRYGSSIWQTLGVTLREKYDAVLQKMHGADTGQVAANSTSQNVIPNTVAESSPTAATASDAGSLSSPTPSAATPPPSTAESSSAPEPSMTAHAAAPASVKPQDVDTRSNPRSSRKTTHSAYSHTVEKAAIDQASSGDDEIGTITVAPALMQANLVASRVPAYPEAAKADHIEGPVTVQAIISKAGVVDYVHVIEGDPRLRSAAAEAVQKWRYKPYLLNGQPVEVATTVTVNFKLDR